MRLAIAAQQLINSELGEFMRRECGWERALAPRDLVEGGLTQAAYSEGMRSAWALLRDLASKDVDALQKQIEEENGRRN